MPNDGAYGEIEIGLYRLLQDSYQIELRVADPDSEAEIAPARGQAAILISRLQELRLDPAAYGETLAAQLFGDSAVREHYIAIKAAFESRGLPLRFRILIGPGAPELHAVRWELLCDPQTKAALATSERTLLSRFLLSRDWRLIDLRPKKELKALIAVSAPSNAAEYGLALVPMPDEIARAREALGGIQTDVAGDRQPLTLDSLMAALRRGVDVVYLVCHGLLLNGVEPWLFLQNEAGQVARVSGASLAQRIAELPYAPRLIVLASCESAGREENSNPQEIAAAAHSALAPRLAESGVPAVIAMQGKISIETVKLAMPVFFKELMRDGQIDRAMAVARGAVRGRPDSWMPALYLRLKSGRIWYEPGFGGGDKDEFQRWAAVCNWVRKRQFIPILGPELGEDLFGGTRELASRLAEKHGFPLAEHDRTDLAKVAQYIGTNQDRNFAQDAVQAQFVAQLAERIDPGSKKPVKELLDLAVARCSSDPDHPYAMLAALPASIYVNAGSERMLFRTLKAAGKNPEAVHGSWRRLGAEVPTEPKPKNETPTPDAPWVYHVFGVFGERDSLVVTEDDFFDYLIATSTDKLMPRKIRGSLVQNSLLFLGFRLDDWRFRILFRMIMTMQGAQTLSDYSHVGVQVNPDEHTLYDVKRAMKYIESYFQESKGGTPRISIYWGSAQDFLKELRKRLAETASEEPVAAAQAADDEYI